MNWVDIWPICYGLKFLTFTWFSLHRTGSVFERTKIYVRDKGKIRVWIMTLFISLFLVFFAAVTLFLLFNSLNSYQYDYVIVRHSNFSKNLPSGTYTWWSLSFLWLSQFIFFCKIAHVLGSAFLKGREESNIDNDESCKF